MNVLVIGDEHTYGYGLPEGKLSYLGHFIRQISQTGQKVSVEAYAHLTLPQLSSLLAQLPLTRYDLIILQFNQDLLQSIGNPASGSTVFATPTLPYSLTTSGSTGRLSLWQRLKPIGMTLFSAIWPPYIGKKITALLKQLRSYRHNVLVVTPLPHQNWINGWLRKRSRAILLKEADKQLFSVFDTDTVIQPREEYFQASSHDHLNAVSHELLGRELFDFYQSAPTIITIQAIRREQE
ncbi:SGNH/GDSL hydrolase family protein [Spirosoma sp.]|uniref:SGNH/GDSL hydrolase family protein n=1 Tax=Spirosoma sp. TaxID=1899569 RepID=UPI003B3BD220